MKSETKAKLQSAKSQLVVGVVIMIGGGLIWASGDGNGAEANTSLKGLGLVIIVLGMVVYGIGYARRWWYRDK